MHDQLATGRRFRVLNIVDDVTRECLAAVIDTSISGRRVVRELGDLIGILPVPVHQARQIMADLPARIRAYGDELLIKPSKSSLVRYTKTADGQVCELIAGKGTNGLEYLGFRFDGRDVFLRDATMSNLYRKVASVAGNQAEAIVKRYANKSYEELCEAFNFEQFSKRFGRVEGFKPNSSNKMWTFWTYVVRAAEEFGPSGRKIMGQVGRLKRRSRARVGYEIARALQRRMKRNAGSISLS